LIWGASLTTGFVLFDVAPSTEAQVIVTAVALVLGLAMQVVLVSTTTSLLQAIDSRNAFGRNKLDNINKYLESRSVRRELASEIVDFFAYKLSSSAVSLQDVDFSVELPSNLSMQLTLELHKTLVKKCMIFTALPSKLVVPLLRKLQPFVAVPGEVVVREGHVNEKLFFVHRGTVHVVKNFGELGEQKLAKLEDNDFFGEASLMPEEAGGRSKPFSFKRSGKAKATVVCVSYSEFLTLSHLQLIALSEEHQGMQSDIQAAISSGVEQRTTRLSAPGGKRSSTGGPGRDGCDTAVTDDRGSFNRRSQLGRSATTSLNALSPRNVAASFRRRSGAEDGASATPFGAGDEPRKKADIGRRRSVGSIGHRISASFADTPQIAPHEH